MNPQTRRRQNPAAWCFLSGRTAALEDRLLSSESLAAMADASDTEALRRSLAETPYGARLDSVGDLAEPDRCLEEFWGAELDEIRRLSPDPGLVGLFALDADFQNCKSWLKQRLFEMPYHRLPAGQVSDEEFGRVMEGLYTPAFDLFGEPTARLQRQVEAEAATAVTVDWIFDAHFLSLRLQLAVRLGVPLIRHCIERTSELQTAGVVLRALVQPPEPDGLRALFLPALPPRLAAIAQELLETPPEHHGDALRAFLTDTQASRIQTAEDAPHRNQLLALEIERAVVETAEPARAVPFGPERVFSYLVRLRGEIRNVKILLGGKACRMDSEQLKKRIVLPGQV